MASYKVFVGDVRDELQYLPSDSVHCCVTSPPYFGLRDYGHDGQIGLEDTPEAFVAKLVEVFREVRRVLRDDGTLWLNLGDSYAGGGGGNYSKSTKQTAHGGHITNVRNRGGWLDAAGVKEKDLIGIPWRVAFALQQPYYTGKVADERDRVWLAAMVDAEGSICGTEYTTGDRTKTNLFISVTNTSAQIIEKCERLFPQDVKHVYEKAGPSSRVCYRWDVERMETKALFIREIYPYLVAKRKQAIVAYTFLEMQRGLPSKKKGYLPEQHEQRSWLMSALSRLNAGEDVDLPEWVVEPPSLFEPGFYLRQDIIWAKPNPMPESVRDRCTKSHEYLFLLSKSPRYYFDHEAIKEPSIYAPGKTAEVERAPGYYAGKHHAKNESGRNDTSFKAIRETRNKRSVWSVATRPFKGAHFATFPPDLIEPCILAGCPEGGTVMDPFGGSGTTAGVAVANGRSALLCELNPKYAEMIPARIASIAKHSTFDSDFD